MIEFVARPAQKGGPPVLSGHAVPAVLVPAALTGPQGWVAPATVLAGAVLLLVALFRRTRATLAKKRRSAQPGTAEWW
ncbi:hypothetical protein [Saccharopolyspora rosea]|uniref:Uncharacterized protein n=1 Tax=Saccharopolyspora rosea TaxID=524884 RepID=A0ABW3FSY0_9PSEU|nr:hypothetical protein [Saccharopolyspora rosea]